MISVRVKLTFAIVAVSVLSVVLLGTAARYITSSQFDRLRLDQAEATFVEAVSNYYEVRRSWDGIGAYVENTLRTFQEDGGGGGGPGRGNTDSSGEIGSRARVGAAGRDQGARLGTPGPPWRSPFALANTDGRVLVAAGGYKVGDVLPAKDLRGAATVTVDDRVVGLVSNMGPPELRSLERTYLRRTGATLFYVTLVVASIALVIGMFASGMLLRPIKDVTDAIRKMRAGDLAQSVPVRTRDEFGEMAVAFNAMSAEVAKGLNLREQMAADIAHELRTPLSVITGYLEGIRDGVLTPTVATVATMYDEARHLQGLVEDLRVLSLADAGSLTLMVEATAVDELLQGAAAAFAAMATQAGVRLDVEGSVGLAPIDVDPHRMRQVLTNLVTNALHFSRAGGHVTLRAHQDAFATTLSVEDTGKGIDPETLPYVFDRFYRADASRNDGQGSSGLGLAIARSLVEAHGGTIGAASTLGAGTVMSIRLPRSSK